MKIIKHIYIFKDTHLPERGWLQGCYVCSQITSRNITFKSIELEKKTNKFIVYLCPSCRCDLEKDDEQNLWFINKCNRFTRNYLNSC